MACCVNGKKLYAPGVPVDFASTLTYFGGELIGAFLGAVVMWLAYKQHFDDEPEPANKLGVFSTGPAIRSYAVEPGHRDHRHLRPRVRHPDRFGGRRPPDSARWPVALLVVGIGASLGGPTGYAINPARDLGPRIAHALLPIKGKGSSDWAYSWVPVVGPLIGGVLGGLAAPLSLPIISHRSRH